MFILCCQVPPILGDSTYNTLQCCYPSTIQSFIFYKYPEKVNNNFGEATTRPPKKIRLQINYPPSHHPKKSFLLDIIFKKVKGSTPHSKKTPIFFYIFFLNLKKNGLSNSTLPLQMPLEAFCTFSGLFIPTNWLNSQNSIKCSSKKSARCCCFLPDGVQWCIDVINSRVWLSAVTYNCLHHIQLGHG